MDLEKAIQSYQKKKEYNQRYYQEKIKPLKGKEKNLSEIVLNLQMENQSLRESLELCNERIRELMIVNSRSILPDLNRRF